MKYLALNQSERVLLENETTLRENVVVAPIQRDHGANGHQVLVYPKINQVCSMQSYFYTHYTLSLF